MGDTSSQRANLAHSICFVGMTTGIVAIICGFLWNAYAKAQHVWTPNQAAEYKAAYNALHAAISGHAEKHPAANHTVPDPAVVAAAKARFARIQSELEAARFAKNRLGSLVAALGLAIAGAFGVGYLLARGDAS